MKADTSITPTLSTCSRVSSVHVSIRFAQPLRIRLTVFTAPGREQVRKGPISISEFEVTLADMYARFLVLHHFNADGHVSAATLERV